MSRRYPGKPQRMKVKRCGAERAWVVHLAHPWSRNGRDVWCPGWKGGVR